MKEKSCSCEHEGGGGGTYYCCRGAHLPQIHVLENNKAPPGLISNWPPSWAPIPPPRLTVPPPVFIVFFHFKVPVPLEGRRGFFVKALQKQIHMYLGCKSSTAGFFSASRMQRPARLKAPQRPPSPPLRFLLVAPLAENDRALTPPLPVSKLKYIWRCNSRDPSHPTAAPPPPTVNDDD